MLPCISVSKKVNAAKTLFTFQLTYVLTEKIKKCRLVQLSEKERREKRKREGRFCKRLVVIKYHSLQQEHEMTVTDQKTLHLSSSLHSLFLKTFVKSRNNESGILKIFSAIFTVNSFTKVSFVLEARKNLQMFLVRMFVLMSLHHEQTDYLTVCT